MNNRSSVFVKAIAVICVLFMLVNICFVFLPHSDAFCDSDCVYCIIVKISESILLICATLSLVFGNMSFLKNIFVGSDKRDKNPDSSLVMLKVKLSN